MYKVNFDFKYTEFLKFMVINIMLIVFTCGLGLLIFPFNAIQFILDNSTFMTKEEYEKLNEEEF